MKNVKKLSNKEPTKDISKDDLKSKIPLSTSKEKNSKNFKKFIFWRR